MIGSGHASGSSTFQPQAIPSNNEHPNPKQNTPTVPVYPGAPVLPDEADALRGGGLAVLAPRLPAPPWVESRRCPRPGPRRGRGRGPGRQGEPAVRFKKQI